MKTTLGAALACGMVWAAAAGATPLPEKFLYPDVATLETSLGTIRIKLYKDQAPATVANFLRYVDDKFYNGLIFHRVVPNFMLQGGGHAADLTERKTREPVKNESANGLSNKRGTVAVARTVNPDSGTSQFFINVKDNSFLDKANARDGAGYCVFGEVIEGMDVVDRIMQVKTESRAGQANLPVEPVLIKSVRRGR
jgi:peptidyl-prolyl cis-trans isomerase B (cyclophilin B)